MGQLSYKIFKPVGDISVIAEKRGFRKEGISDAYEVEVMDR